MLAVPRDAWAQDYTWAGPGSSTASLDYNLGANWSPTTGAPPATAGQTAVFNTTGSGAVTLFAPVEPDGWRIDAAAQPYTISGAAVTFVAQGLTNNSASPEMVANSIGGTGAVVQDGAGSLTLSAANAYSGGTQIKAGTLAVGNSAALGSGGVVLGNGGFLQAASEGLSIGNMISVAEGAGAALDANGNRFTLSGTITVASGAELTVIDRCPAKTGRVVLTGQSASAGISVSEAALTIASTGVLSGVKLISASLINAGMVERGLTIDAASFANNTGAIGSAGVPSGLAVTNNGALSTSGTITGGLLNNGAANAAGTIDGAIINIGEIMVTGALQGNGELENRGGLTVGDQSVTGLTALGNFSSVEVGGGGSLRAGEIVNNQGGTFTSRGTLATAIGFANAGTLMAQGVLNGAVLNVGIFDVTGDLAGITVLSQHAGVVDLGGTTLDVTTLDYTGGTIRNGVLSASSAVSLSGDGTIEAALTGNASLTKSGTGSIELSALNTYTGDTTITGGTLIVDAGAPSSAVTVQDGATLAGGGTIGALRVAPGGGVQPGLAVPYVTLTVRGNLTFQAGSTYTVRIDPLGRTDLIRTDGRAMLNGGTVGVLAADGTYVPSRTYTILTAAEGLTGRFTRLVTSSDLAFLNPMLTYTANDVVLGFVPSAVTFASVALTTNQSAVATAIEGMGAGTGTGLYDAVLSQSAAGARAAFDAASGEAHASAAIAGVQDSIFVQGTILDRLRKVVPATDLPTSSASNPFGALAPALPPQAQGYAPGRVLPALAMVPPSYAFWGTAFGDFGRNGTNGNAAALVRALGGFVLGGDVRVDSGPLSAWRIGIAGGYTRDSLDVRARASSGTFRSAYGGIYGGARYGAVSVKMGMLAGHTDTRLDRTVAFPALLERERAYYGGWSVQGFGEVGYGIALATSTIEPIAQAAVIHLAQNAFREEGGAAALTGAGRQTDVETTTLGMRAETALLNGLPLNGRALLGWRHAFGDTDPTALVGFAAGGPAFTVAGTPIDRNAVVAEAGIDYRPSRDVMVGLDYIGQAGVHANDNAVRGRIEVSF